MINCLKKHMLWRQDFERLLSDTKETTVPKHCIAGPKKANSYVLMIFKQKFVLEKYKESI